MRAFSQWTTDVHFSSWVSCLWCHSNQSWIGTPLLVMQNQLDLVGDEVKIALVLLWRHFLQLPQHVLHWLLSPSKQTGHKFCSHGCRLTVTVLSSQCTKKILLRRQCGQRSWELQHLPSPNALVAASKTMRAVKLCTNKILQFLTGGAG